MKKLLIVFGIAIILFFNTGQAHAAVLWDWLFINSGSTVGPTDIVYQAARLFNYSTNGETIGPEVLGPDAVVATAHADLAAGYDVNVILYSEINTIINAGESFDFIFAIYTPLGSAAPGIYTTPSQWIGLRLRDGTDLPLIINSYTWNVGDSSVVPEPATMLLLGTGLLGAGIIGRKRK